MTLSKCLECGSEQDFEDAVGYCEKCGKKLPVPHTRGKTSARKEFASHRRDEDVGTSNVVVTVLAALVALIGVGFAIYVVAGGRI